MGERIRISNGEVWLDEETGIVRVELDPGSTSTLEDAKAQIAAVIKVSGGKRRPLLVDHTNRYQTQECREYFASDESLAAWRAVALVSASTTGTAVGSMWLASYGTPENPGRVYASEAPAVEWLKTFVEP